MRIRCVAGGLAFLLCTGAPVLAQPLTEPGSGPTPEPPATPESSDQPAQQEREPSIATSLPAALADPGGVRVALEEAGIVYSLTYIADALGNVSGGIRRAAAYQGRFDFQLDADLEKLAGIPGLVFHTNFCQIDGRGLSTCCLGNLLTVSGIKATPATRLFEIWLEHKLFDGKLALRAGQLSADTEFQLTQYGALFVNATFGWPAISAANLPNGSPAYLLATPGVRVEIAPVEPLFLMVGVFNGDPARPNGDEDLQRRNRSGSAFRTSDPAFVIAEAAYAYNKGKGAVGLPGTIKLGGYHHFGRFNDQHFGIDGRSVADPDSSDIACRFRGNSGIYAVLDQLVYQVPTTADSGVGAFLHVSGAAPSNRNLVSFYVDGGLTFKGLTSGRPENSFGIGTGYAQVSGCARPRLRRAPLRDRRGHRPRHGKLHRSCLLGPLQRDRHQAYLPGPGGAQVHDPARLPVHHSRRRQPVEPAGPERQGGPERRSARAARHGPVLTSCRPLRIF